MKKRYSFTAFLFLWIISCAVLAQQIMIVSVTSKGFGRTEQEAVSDAIINGVAQVNGETIAASMRVKTSSIESTSGQESGARGTHARGAGAVLRRPPGGWRRAGRRRSRP